MAHEDVAVWTYEELCNILENHVELFITHSGVKKGGNVPKKHDIQGEQKGKVRECLPPAQNVYLSIRAERACPANFCCRHSYSIETLRGRGERNNRFLPDQIEGVTG